MIEYTKTYRLGSDSHGLPRLVESEAGNWTERADYDALAADRDEWKRLWQERDVEAAALAARLAEATDLIDEAYSHGDTASWGERAAKWLRAANSADAGRVGGFAEFASGGRKIEPGEVIEFRPEPEVSASPCRHSVAKAKAVNGGLDSIVCECGVTLTALTADDERRPCTCPDGERPIPCPRKFAVSECQKAAGWPDAGEES